MSAFLERAPVPMLTHSELLLKISTELNLKTEKMLNNTIRLKCCPFESSTPPGLGTSLLKSFYLKIILENTLIFFCQIYFSLLSLIGLVWLGDSSRLCFVQIRFLSPTDHCCSEAAGCHSDSLLPPLFSPTLPLFIQLCIFCQFSFVCTSLCCSNLAPFCFR